MIRRVSIKCCTSYRYARRVRALFLLANQTSSSGICKRASTVIRCGVTCLDGSIAFVVFFAIVLSFLFRPFHMSDNPVYLTKTGFTSQLSANAESDHI